MPADKTNLKEALPEGFCYDPKKESADEYLTRASVWIDVMERGEEAEKKVIAEMLGSRQAYSELKNYVFSVMNEILERLARANSKKLVTEDCFDEFMNEYRILVWNSFYRFNNPKYRSDECSYCFSTFAVHYLKQAAWQVQLHRYGISDRTYRNSRRIRRTEELLAKAGGISHELVSDDDIRNMILKQDGILIPVREIRDIRNMLSPVSEIPENYFMPEDMILSDVSGEEVTEVLEEFVRRYHTLQIFVFLQNFGFCSRKYKNMIVEDLAKDPVFIRLCRSDLSARKRLCTGSMDENTKCLKQSFSDDVGNEAGLHLKEKYIFNMRVYMKDEFSSYLNRKKLKPYQLRNHLGRVMYRTWDNIMLLYEIENQQA